MELEDYGMKIIKRKQRADPAKRKQQLLSSVVQKLIKECISSSYLVPWFVDFMVCFKNSRQFIWTDYPIQMNPQNILNHQCCLWIPRLTISQESWHMSNSTFVNVQNTWLQWVVVIQEVYFFQYVCIFIVATTDHKLFYKAYFKIMQVCDLNDPAGRRNS